MSQEEQIPITQGMSQAEIYEAEAYNRAMVAKDKDVNQRRVLVTSIEFQVDGYPAATRGIAQSIRLGWESPSIGGSEPDILRAVWEKLVEMDPDLSSIPMPWEKES